MKVVSPVPLTLVSFVILHHNYDITYISLGGGISIHHFSESLNFEIVVKNYHDRVTCISKTPVFKHSYCS